MDLMHKSAELALEYKDDDTEYGGFSGYASTFNNVDLTNDIIEKGAFAETIKARKKEIIPLLWQHNTGEPIGKITSMMEDEKGLLVSGTFSGTPKGQQARQLLKEGIISKMSIGYQVDKVRYDDRKGIRYIESLKLFEISLVTFPANEKASVTGVKEAIELPKTTREFENWLRDNGFSRKLAKEITSCGFKQRDAEPAAEHLNQLNRAIIALASTIKGVPHGNRNN